VGTHPKPIEHGFKFHCLADHGYVYDFHPTSNQAGPDPVPPVEGLTPTGEVVYHLLTKLPKSRHWTVYLDNFYTTVPLLGRLRHDLKIAACGTARPSSAASPKDLKMDKKDVSKLEYHSTETRVVNDPTLSQDVGALRWIDNAPVTMLTTAHELAREVERERIRPGKKSTNAKKAHEHFGDEFKKEMPIPACIDDYNHHMGGVDIADQLRSYYDMQLTSWRTWWPLFFYGTDTMVINAYHIFSSMEDVPDISHKDFRMEVAWGLINAGPPPRIPPPATVPRPTVTQNTQLPAGRFTDSAHMPEHSENKKTCYLCRFNHKGEGISKSLPLTRWGCSDCKVPLCLNDKRNCFADLHDPEA
jgi:hypothetical protein